MSSSCHPEHHPHPEHRHDQHVHRGEHDHEEAHGGNSCCGAAACGQPVTADAPLPAGARSQRYRIDKMDCPTEERLIRQKLEAMNGIVRLDFNLLARELTVHHQCTDDAAIVSALQSLDMAPVTLTQDSPAGVLPPALSSKQKWLLAAAGGAAVGAELTAWITGHEASLPVMLLTLLSILAAGLPTLKKGWIALQNRALNIYFLMSLAVMGAVLIGKWPEAAMVIFLFAVAEAIEALSLERARNAIRALTALAPDTAEVLTDNGWQTQAPANVAVGSRIRVRTGARVPLDSTVVNGNATLDQAPITGESLPVEKQAGNTLYAGSIVTDGVVEARVTASAGDSTLSRIATAIQQAQSQQAPTQRLVDKFARYYTPVVVLLALLIAVLGPLLFEGGVSHWLYEALVMLVIACPCALVVSTPVTVVSGLAAAAHEGILVKGGAYLEAGHRLRAIALDKTGTLTHGKPALTDVIPLNGVSEAQALLYAASLDEHSTHPVAQALVQGYQQRQAGTNLLPVEDFRVLNGRGVRGVIAGEEWRLGNHRLVEEWGLCSPALEKQLEILERQGKTAIVLVSLTGPVALFGVADTVRPESVQAVAHLQALDVKTVMLTGDNEVTANAIASQVGIQDARGNLLPDDKQTLIRELQQRYGVVGMVGDGVNDAPALATADIGFAMGSAGTATALETADVAIMDDDTRKLARFIDISKKTVRILQQNIALALGIKLLFLALAATGQATLWMAVFADMGASLLVVANGLRLILSSNHRV